MSERKTINGKNHSKKIEIQNVIPSISNKAKFAGGFCLHSSDQTERSVRLNCSAELLLCGSAQTTELFSAEHITFFTATFHIFVLLNDPHVRSIIISL